MTSLEPLSTFIADLIRPVSFIHPCLHILPKTHKYDVPYFVLLGPHLIK